MTDKAPCYFRIHFAFEFRTFQFCISNIKPRTISSGCFPIHNSRNYMQVLRQPHRSKVFCFQFLRDFQCLIHVAKPTPGKSWCQRFSASSDCQQVPFRITPGNRFSFPAIWTSTLILRQPNLVLLPTHINGNLRLAGVSPYTYISICVLN